MENLGRLGLREPHPRPAPPGRRKPDGTPGTGAQQSPVAAGTEPVRDIHRVPRAGRKRPGPGPLAARLRTAPSAAPPPVRPPVLRSARRHSTPWRRRGGTEGDGAARQVDGLLTDLLLPIPRPADQQLRTAVAGRSQGGGSRGTGAMPGGDAWDEHADLLPSAPLTVPRRPPARASPR